MLSRVRGTEIGLKQPWRGAPQRLHGMIVKEFLHLWRDRFGLALTLLVPVAMLFIFGWAVNTDVKHIATVVWDQSGSPEARALLEAFRNSQYFDVRYWARSSVELARAIDEGRAKVGLVIPPDYARRLSRHAAHVQVIVDASDPIVATSAISAAAALGFHRSLGVLSGRLDGTALLRHRDRAPLDIRVRATYNPDLAGPIFIVPGLIGIILMQTTIATMAVIVVREREKGTLEALVVSPVRRWELMLGWSAPHLDCAPGGRNMWREAPWATFPGRPMDDGFLAPTSSRRPSSTSSPARRPSPN